MRPADPEHLVEPALNAVGRREPLHRDTIDALAFRQQAVVTADAATAVRRQHDDLVPSPCQPLRHLLQVQLGAAGRRGVVRRDVQDLHDRVRADM